MTQPKEKFTPVCNCTISETKNYTVRIVKCPLCSASKAMYEALKNNVIMLEELAPFVGGSLRVAVFDLIRENNKAIALVEGGK